MFSRSLWVLAVLWMNAAYALEGLNSLGMTLNSLKIGGASGVIYLLSLVLVTTVVGQLIGERQLFRD